jgi:type II secretory pathway predicted ATPase ExeA
MKKGVHPMYLKFYGLKKEPFQITPDPEFVYLSLSHKEALYLLAQGVKQFKGFIILTGEVGVGKTTVVHTFIERCRQQQIKTICILNSRVTFGLLMNMILDELGIERRSEDAAELVHGLYRFLVEEHRQGRSVVLVIDEAQNMSINTLESLRMLFDLESPQGKLLQILLIGQPELEAKLDLHELKQIHQYIGVRISITEMTPDESLSYIRHRLTKAGAQQNDTAIFAPAALRLIVKRSLGIPRKMNNICDNALISGFGYGRKPIPLKVVKDVISDLDGKPTRVSARWVITCASIAFLFLIIAGFIMVLTMDFPKLMKNMSFHSIIAKFGGVVDRSGESVSPVSTPVLPENFPAPLPAPGFVQVPDSPSSSVGQMDELQKSEAGVVDKPDSTVSQGLNLPLDQGASPADDPIQKAEKPLRGTEAYDPSSSTVSKPRTASEEPSPDPNKLIDWFLKKRSR